MFFLVFIGFLYPPPAWKAFLLGQKSSPKDFLSVVVVYAFFFSANCSEVVCANCVFHWVLFGGWVSPSRNEDLYKTVNGQSCLSNRTLVEATFESSKCL